MVGLLVAGTTPAGAAPGAASRYQVRRGDTLSAIAARLGVSVSRLVSANSIADPNHVMAGVWLDVPTGSSGSAAAPSGSGSTGSGTHKVKPGETLSAIAARYGLSTAALAQANSITNPNLLVSGRTLQIPGGGSAAAAAPVSGGGGGGGGSSSLPLRLRQSPERLALIPVFDRWSAQYGVPADLVKAVTWLESGWQPNVVSSTGAVGIGQLMPATVTTVNQILGTSLSAWVPEENIRMSARYLALLLSVTSGNTRKALAGYYQGLASVQRNGMYTSTIAYIDGVLALRSRFG